MREAISIKKDQHDGTEHRSVTTSSFKLRLENEENPSETSVELVPDASTLDDVKQLARSLFNYTREVILIQNRTMLSDQATWRQIAASWDGGAGCV